jgi:hypothetical protein
MKNRNTLNKCQPSENSPFHRLNDDVLYDCIFPLLDLKDKAQFTKTCRRTAGLFKEPMEKLALETLLEKVAKGDEMAVEKIMQTKPELWFQKGKVTDYSDRTFKSISPIQYAAWALDTYMLKRILKNISNDERSKALDQLNELEIKGTEYGAHYNFTHLQKVLKEYIEKFRTWSDEERINYWCKQVGGAQCDVPVHVVNEYCNPKRSFYPLTQSAFYEDDLPRKLNVCLDLSGKTLPWFPLSINQGLGTKFAIYSNGGFNVAFASWGVTRSNEGAWSSDFAFPQQAQVDLDAITRLFTVRIETLKEIKQGLRQQKSRCLIA